ncbi:MAG: S8 family serine peptidase [Acidobacteriota bacterium]
MRLERTLSYVAALLVVTPTLIAPNASATELRELAGLQYEKQRDSWIHKAPDGQVFAVNSRVITVKFADGTRLDDQKALLRSLGGYELRRAVTGYVDVEIAYRQDVFAAIDTYLDHAEIVSAEPNTFGTYTLMPNDPIYGSQWYPPIVQADLAWDTTGGNPSAVIAVLDSGTEFTHEDLGFGPDGYQNVWLNDGEDAWSDPDDPSTGDGIDNDGNGYVDDWKGYDFNNNNNDGSGTNFHGTAVAGVAAAKTNNGLGITGIAGGVNGPGARVMIAGVGDGGPNGAILDDAILYAVDNGADVVQLSLSVGQTSAINAAIQTAIDAGLAIVCSSGNGGAPVLSYPASNPNVISAGATTSSDQRSGFSQHGPDLDLSAPGSNIFTLDLNDTYDFTSGTSFSSPLISGVIALMLSVNPNLTPAEIRQILHDTADKVGGYDYNYDPDKPGHSFELGYGRVNALRAIGAANSGSLFADSFESGDTAAWPGEDKR